MRKYRVFVLFALFVFVLTPAGCDSYLAKAEVLPHGGEGDPDKAGAPREENPGNSAEMDNADIHSLLEKGTVIRNLSYTARFSSADNEYVYEYYKRDNLTKIVTHDGESQSIAVSDGKSTVYYNLPEKIGFTMMEAGDDMGLVPSTEALLNGEIYQFRTMGEETLSGYNCQVVETEDEFGALKLWISKTLGLPIKYIGSDDNGWYNLELTEIKLGEPSNSIFAIPTDIRMM